MAKYPINNKEDLIAAIKEMSAKDKKDAGLDTKENERLGATGDEKKKLAGLAEQNRMLAETARILGNINDSMKFQLEAVEAQLKSNEEINRIANEMNMTREEFLRKVVAGEDAALEKIKEGSDELKNQVASYKELIDAEDARNKYQKANKRLFDDITGAIGMNINMQNTFYGKMVAVNQQLRMGGEEGDKARAQFIRDLKESFSLGKAFYSLMMKIAESSVKVATEFDKARAQLAASTGAGYKFAGGLFDAQRSARLFGVTMDDAKNATAGLVEGTSNFAKMNKDSRAELTQTTAMMGRLGIDTAMAAETFQFMNVVLGKSVEQSQDFQKELAMMGTSIGIPPKKMTKDFNAALPMLAVYGDRAVKVFSNLAAAAKAAGVETSTLLGIAKQYDTFAGAAEGSAKLNALLGTQLSTTQMLMMTEDERIETLIGSVQAQGVAFKDMDRFTQKAIMAAAGITDLNEANKIFGMSVDAYRENQREMARSAEVQKQFEDAVAATVPVLEKFKLLAGEFIISIQPFLNKLGEIAEKVTAILRDTDDETKRTFANIVVGTGVVFGLVGAVGTLIGTYKAYKVATTVMSVATKGAAAAQEMLNASQMKSQKIASKGGGFRAIGALAHPKVAAGIGVLTLAIIGLAGAYNVYASGKAKIVEAEAATAKAQAREAEAYQKTAEALGSLSAVNFDNISLKIKEIVQDLAQIGKNNSIMVRTRSTIENLALISTGQAKDSMTGNIVQASAANVTANVNNVFSGMKMVLDVGGKQIEGVIRDIAQQEANA